MRARHWQRHGSAIDTFPHSLNFGSSSLHFPSNPVDPHVVPYPSAKTSHLASSEKSSLRNNRQTFLQGQDKVAEARTARARARLPTIVSAVDYSRTRT